MSTTTQLTTASPPFQENALPPLILTRDIHPRVTFEEMVRLCALNDHLNFEWDPDGTLYIMSPAGSDSSHKNAELTFQLVGWTKRDASGRAFDSSGGFVLADGKLRSPDVAWVQNDRWERLPEECRRKGFAPITPDFVAELRSSTDNLAELRAKMDLYRQNGVRLGWLIDPIDHAVEIYRPSQETERLDNPRTLDGGDVLPGFTLDLKPILFD